MWRCALLFLGSIWCSGIVIFAETPNLCFCETFPSVQGASVESILAQAASSPTNLHTQVVVEQDDGGWFLLQIVDHGYVSSDVGEFEGYVMDIENNSTNDVALSVLPARIEAVSLRSGSFDLSNLGENVNVKYLNAACVSLNVSVAGICKRFPRAEMICLSVFDLNNRTDVDIDSLVHLKRLRRLHLTHHKPSPGDFVRRLVLNMPQLERLTVWGDFAVGVVGKGWSEDKMSEGIYKPKCIDLSDALATTNTCVVDIPDFGDCIGMDIKISAPVIHFVDIRPSAVDKKLYSLYLKLTNVIPRGEDCLVENGIFRYSIDIDKRRGGRVCTEKSSASPLKALEVAR